MSHQDFDEKVRQSLEGVASQIHSGASWDQLAQRLERESNTPSEDVPESEQQALFIEEELFDRNIKESIQQSSVPNYEHKHWLLLAEQLEEQDERLAWLYRHKFAELSIVILLLFAFINVLNIPITKLEVFSSPFQKTTAKNINRLNNQEKEQEDKSNLSTINHQQTLSSSYVKEDKVSNASHTSSKRLPQAISKNLNRETPILPIPVLHVKSERVTELSQLPKIVSNISLLNNEMDSKLHFLYAPQKEKKHYWSLGFVAVMDFNAIYTPKEFFLGKEINAYTEYSLGGGGGFTLSKEYKKMAWESGLIYITKKYQPKQLYIISSNNRGIKFKETLRNVQINLLEIPFTYRYKFLRKQKIDYFASIGSALNVITQANYDNSRSYYPTYALAALDKVEPTSEIKKVKKFNDGLFEGGKIQDNIYISGQAAIGLEYKISPRFSFINQVSYQRHLTLKGIGVNNNSYNAYSVWVGLKTKF